jgi:hypothetical protein
MGLMDWWNTGYTPAEKSMSIWDLIKDDVSKVTKSDEAYGKYGQSAKGWRPKDIGKVLTPDALKTGPTPLVRGLVRAIPQVSAFASAFAPSNSIMSQEEEMAMIERWKQKQTEQDIARLLGD